MGDIRTFNTQRRGFHAQRILDILQRRRTRGQIADALELVLAQRILGILFHRFHQRTLIAALRDTQIHLRTTQVFQKLDYLIRLFGHGVHENFTRDNFALPGRSAGFLVYSPAL